MNVRLPAGGSTSDMSTWLQSACAAVALLEPSWFSVVRVSGPSTGSRLLAADRTDTYSLKYRINVGRNATLRSASMTDLAPEEAQDLDDALYFAHAAAEFSGQLLVSAVNGAGDFAAETAPQPVLNCSKLESVIMRQRLCPAPGVSSNSSQPPVTSAPAEIVHVSLANFLSASMVAAGYPDLSASTVITIDDPVVTSGLSGSTVLQVAADGTASRPAEQQATTVPAPAVPTAAVIGGGVAAGVVAAAAVLLVAAVVVRMRSQRATPSEPAARGRTPRGTLTANPIIRGWGGVSAGPSQTQTNPVHGLAAAMRGRRSVAQSPLSQPDTASDLLAANPPAKTRGKHGSIAMIPQMVRR